MGQFIVNFTYIEYKLWYGTTILEHNRINFLNNIHGIDSYEIVRFNKLVSGKKMRKLNAAVKQLPKKIMRTSPSPPRYNETFIGNLHGQYRCWSHRTNLGPIPTNLYLGYWSQNHHLFDTELDGSADSVPQGNLPDDTNISNVEPSISDNNNDVVTATRLFKDTPNPNRITKGFLKPP